MLWDLKRRRHLDLSDPFADAAEWGEELPGAEAATHQEQAAWFGGAPFVE
jgi:hypothetical protein